MYIICMYIYIYASALVLTLGQVEMKFTIYIHLLRLLPHFGPATKKKDRNHILRVQTATPKKCKPRCYRLALLMRA